MTAWIRRLFARPHRTVRNAPAARLGCESLEAREVPAYLSGGVLVIDGTAGDDVVSVTNATIQMGWYQTVPGYKVTENGRAQWFTTQSVSGAAIWFRGNAGNDQFSAWVGIQVVAEGGIGKDTLTGGYGWDYLYGGSEDDVLFGGEGVDYLYGGEGFDQLHGGGNDDHLFGGGGWDQLHGNAGNDELVGDALTPAATDAGDELYGGTGNDVLRGGGGDDYLRGEGDNDVLYGDGGDDGLFGGAGTNTLYGGADDDRFLMWSAAADRAMDRAPNDALIPFWDTTQTTTRNSAEVDSAGNPITAPLRYGAASWSEAEINAIDGALMWAHQLTGNTRLLKPAAGGWAYQGFTREVAYIPWTAAETTGNVARQVANMRGPNYAGWNGSSGIVVNTWGVFLGTNTVQADRMQETVIHELAHNWDEESVVWSDWLAQSGWTSYPPSPQNASLYTRSGDGRWWYLTSANGTFYRAWNDPTDQYSTFNPLEDWTTTWEAYRLNRLGRLDAATAAALAPKFALIDRLVQQLSVG